MPRQPLYLEIRAILAGRIRDGQLPAGTMLPGEMELARQFDCSRVTIRKALEALSGDGLIERHQGRGTIIKGERITEPMRAEVSGLVENLMTMGLRTSAEVLHFAFEEPAPQVRQALGISEGIQALHTVRLRHFKDRPFSYSVAWVPVDVGNTFSRADLASHPLTHLLRRAGVTPSQAHQRVFALAADAITAPALGVPVGSPLLGIERRVEDVAGRCIEHLRVYYHPDRYEFAISLRTDPSAAGGRWEVSPEDGGIA